MDVYIQTTKTSNRGWCFGGLGAEKCKTSNLAPKDTIHHKNKTTTRMQHRMLISATIFVCNQRQAHLMMLGCKRMCLRNKLAGAGLWV
jgi:hypothetical protein